MRLLCVSIFSMLLMALSFAPAFAPSEAAAESEAAFRLAYVDLQRALTESKAGKRAQKDYEKAVKAAQSDIDKKKGEFEKLRESFKKQRESLNEEALQGKEEELIAKERDIKRSFKDSQEKLRRTNAQMVGELMKELRKAVADIGEDKGFTVILEKGAQAVLYADNSIDITDQVVKRFDEIAGN